MAKSKCFIFNILKLLWQHKANIQKNSDGNSILVILLRNNHIRTFIKAIESTSTKMET